MRLSRILALSAAGVAFATAAMAQDAYDQDRYQNGPSEQVIVTAPHYSVDRGHLGSSTEKVSLSQAVSFDDLDLTTRRGAHELKLRIRETVQDICAQLRNEVPYAQPGTRSCHRDAMVTAMTSADRAISDARDETRDGYDDHGY
ncbi:MAG: UrcA family protein [Rhizomicrobium sp.]